MIVLISKLTEEVKSLRKISLIEISELGYVCSPRFITLSKEPVERFISELEDVETKKASQLTLFWSACSTQAYILPYNFEYYLKIITKTNLLGNLR